MSQYSPSRGGSERDRDRRYRYDDRRHDYRRAASNRDPGRRNGSRGDDRYGGGRDNDRYSDQTRYDGGSHHGRNRDDRYSSGGEGGRREYHNDRDGDRIRDRNLSYSRDVRENKRYNNGRDRDDYRGGDGDSRGGGGDPNDRYDHRSRDNMDRYQRMYRESSSQGRSYDDKGSSDRGGTENKGGNSYRGGEEGGERNRYDRGNSNGGNHYVRGSVRSVDRRDRNERDIGRDFGKDGSNRSYLSERDIGRDFGRDGGGRSNLNERDIRRDFGRDGGDRSDLNERDIRRDFGRDRGDRSDLSDRDIRRDFGRNGGDRSDLNEKDIRQDFGRDGGDIREDSRRNEGFVGGRRSGRGGFGGRGRGGRGSGRGGGHGAFSGPHPTEALSNIIPASLTPNFCFYQYGLDVSSESGVPIESRRRRGELFTIGLFDGHQGLFARNGMPPKEVENIRRIIFFEGSFFYSSRRIPFLEQMPFTLVGKPISNTSNFASNNIPMVENGDCMTITCLNVMGPPKILTKTTDLLLQKDPHCVTIDKRCSGCTNAFESIDGLMSHCRMTGHEPYQADEASAPSSIETFVSFCNVSLQRALGERMARWGKEYIDPKVWTEPVDKTGRSLGVRIFRAYSCEFGISYEKDNSYLSLTVDLRAKVIRTRSLLDTLCNDQDPMTYHFDRQSMHDACKKFIGEVVICTYDKRCYSVVDIDFENSPSSLPVDGQNMSHADYFINKKNIHLKYPNVKPIVAVLGRNNSKIYLPAELVCVNDLDPMVKPKLPMIASFPPKDRHDAIEEIKRYLTPGAQKTRGFGGGLLPALGIVIQDRRVKVNCEILPLPLMKAAGMTIPPEKGSMWAPLLSKADYRVNGGQIEMNVVVVYHHSLGRSWYSVYDRIRNIVNGYNSTYLLSQEPYAAVKAGDDRDHWSVVERHFEGRQPSNVFVLDLVKPPRRQALDAAYSIVKHILTENGFLSQFVNFNTYDHGYPRDQRKSLTILQGVARQILSKCGVRIWWVNLPREIPLPAVFVGVDVFHSPRKYNAEAGKKTSKESVAAIVVQVIRSHDEEDNQNVEVYSETFRRHAGNEMELGDCMSQTVSNALQVLNVNPLSCVIWRDGVGSQAINTVAEQEIPAVRQALAAAASSSDSYPQSALRKTPLAYIVVQKRIATKFLSVDGQRSLPCGAYVQGLQTSEHSTFYINGTSPPYSTPKPARFVIAELDEGFGEQKQPERVISDLSWALCHDYSNWTGPIKLPSPVQMAHKLAELAGGMPDCGDNIDARAFAGKIHFL